VQRSGAFEITTDYGAREAAMSFLRAVLLLGFVLGISIAASAQDLASLTGTVRDSSGAVVPNASVTVSSSIIGFKRTTTTNASGDYLLPDLPAGHYDLSISAKGFREFSAEDIILRVAQKARVDATMSVGEATTKVIVEGGTVAQVDTQSSEIAGTITGKELSQLELNGRNFTQLATLMPGVTNQTGQDEGQVGLNGSVQFSFNGGRTEYNNWEVDGGDNMDNGSNTTLNVYPSLDAIQEFRVLTSNYGAQYGRNGSGTIEVETKNGTRDFHGMAYEYNRNDIFNARNFFDTSNPEYKKNDFGYNVGGPVFIPDHYNTDRSKTFFFWSQEWRRDVVPGMTFFQAVPSAAERTGNFNDLCPNQSTGSFVDCPTIPGTNGSQFFPGNQVPVDPNAMVLVNALIPPPTPGAGTGCGGIACFASSPAQATNWREELIRIDHNINDKNRFMFRYIHDSWNTVNPIVLPFGATTSSFPTIQTAIQSPGLGLVARLSTTASSTLVNEFVFSYTTDHLNLTNIGPWQLPAGLTITSLFNNGFGGKLPGISVSGNTAYGPGFTEDPSFIPWNNSNPTYTYRDNVTKIIGKHNLQFGAYFVAAQKNEPSVLDDNGLLTFTATGNTVGTGNAFADLLQGNIASYAQSNQNLKYYNRYKILEPYLQDDWHITSRLTLNLGLRVSLFGTYRERFQQAFNWDPAAFKKANELGVDPNTGALIDPITGNFVPPTDPRIFNGIVQCGVSKSSFPGVGAAPAAGCMQGHLFNPAPRIGFAWDPWGNGKTAVRGGYGIYFEHTNGNEANTESLEGSPPGVLTATQPNISAYNMIGGGSGTVLAFPLGVTAIPTRVIWPYMQQWNLSVEHEVFRNTVASVAYVGSKGTHLNLHRDLNQIAPLPASLNPFHPGEPLITATSAGPNQTANTNCNVFPITVNGNPVTGQASNNLQVACGNDPDPFRPFLGFGDITLLENEANSTYNSLQASLRRTVGPLILSANYTYSHSIDDASDRFDNSFVNSYNVQSLRANSLTDQRHVFNLSYVYDFPVFNHSEGLSRTLLGGWEISGIATIQTGTPYSIFNGVFSDSAGVGNGLGVGSFPTVVGSVNGTPPPIPANSGNAIGPLFANPSAFAAPQGLTFGNAGRDIAFNPRRTNFDMGLFKHFPIREQMAFEFRAEAFNVFNHPQLSVTSALAQGNGGNNTVTCYNGANNSAGDPFCLGGNSFLHPTQAHRGRTLQLALKFLF
jgi:hypothetical protein